MEFSNSETIAETHRPHVSTSIMPPSTSAWRRFIHSLRAVSFPTLVIAVSMTVPLITLVWIALTGEGGSFEHIKNTVLTTYIFNTISLLVLVGILVSIIGIPLAWLIAQCEFPGRRFFNWALVLPLAMPAYVVAYVYTDLLDYAGPVQIQLRDWFGWQTPDDYWFFDIRSIPGAALVLSFVLYPYLYLLVRANFMSQNASFLQAARSLGKSKWQSFYQITLPLARSAIVAGLILVLMETLADFATVNYFAVNTLTTAVYDTWLGHYDLVSAAKLSVIMVLGVFILMYLEKVQKGQRQESGSSKVNSLPIRYTLHGAAAKWAFAYCAFVFTLGFLLPALVLLRYVWTYFAQAWSSELISYTLNSLFIASITAIVAVCIAILINQVIRFSPSKINKLNLQVSSSGYAIPGTVMAIGVLIPLGMMDEWINEAAVALNLSMPGLVLSGSVVVIIVAHVMRFTAIANKGVESHFAHIPAALDDAAMVLKASKLSVFKRIHLALLKPSILVAFLLIFVESMKELSAAILLRPFDFQTLPTYVYQYTSDEQLELASLGALIICLVGLVPLLVLNRSIETSKSEA